MSETAPILDGIRLKLVEHMAKRVRYFTWQFRWWSYLYNGLLVSAVISGPVVAILTANESGRLMGVDAKIWIVVVSNAGSAATALIARLRIADFARARTIGLAGMRNALLKANELLLETHKDAGTYFAELRELRRRISGIEYDQINLIWPVRSEAEDKTNP
jgi:hypothetical protein